MQYIKEVEPIKYQDKNRKRCIRRALYRCECGNEVVVRMQSVTGGHTKTCGCVIKTGLHRTHGMSKDPKTKSTYQSWLAMKQRCHYEKHKDYNNYGGRGITVCDRWRTSFEMFYEDMGLKPGKRYTIDRIDNYGNYEPSNCRWTNDIEQGRNRRNNVVLEYNGKKATIAEWEEITGINRRMIEGRIKSGWEVEEILTTPKVSTDIRINQLTMDGYIVKEWPSMNSTKNEGYQPAHVKKCCEGIFSQHKGYRWEYIE